MTKPVLYEWALDQTSLPPTSQAQWEEGFTYLNAATGGKVPTYVHDYPLSEITKAVRWTLDALPDGGVVSAYVENRFKSNQNWNVEGATDDPLPSASPTLYAIGAEVVSGRFVVDADLVNATYTGGLFDADSGKYYIEYDGDFTGDFYGIKLADNTIVQTGCSISLESGKTRVTVDMSTAPAHKFAGFSQEPGLWPDINDEESRVEIIKKLELQRVMRDVSGSRVGGVEYTNHDAVEREVYISSGGNTTNRFLIDGVDVLPLQKNSSNNSNTGVYAVIPSKSTYQVQSTFPTGGTWNERSLTDRG